MTAANISKRILEVKAINNCTIQEAIDVVLGAGTSAKLVDDLYHSLRGE